MKHPVYVRMSEYRNDATRALVTELYRNQLLDDLLWEDAEQFKAEGTRGKDLEDAMASDLKDYVRSIYDIEYSEAGVLRSFFIDPDLLDYDYRAASRKYVDEVRWDSLSVKASAPRCVPPAGIEDSIAEDFLRSIGRRDIYGMRDRISRSRARRETVRKDVAGTVSAILEVEYDHVVDSEGALVASFVADPRTVGYDPGIVADRLIDALSPKASVRTRAGATA